MKKSRNDVNRKLLQFDTERRRFSFHVPPRQMVSYRYGITLSSSSDNDLDVLPHHCRRWGIIRKTKHKNAPSFLLLRSCSAVCSLSRMLLSGRMASLWRPLDHVLRIALVAHIWDDGVRTQCATNFAKMFLSVSRIHYMLFSDSCCSPRCCCCCCFATVCIHSHTFKWLFTRMPPSRDSPQAIQGQPTLG